MGCVGGGGGLAGRVRKQESLVEGDDGCCGVSAGIVDVGGPVYCTVGGCGIVTVGAFGRCVILVGELRIARDDLICARVRDADGVISWRLIKLDHCGEALSVVQEDRVGRLGFDVKPIDGINPHGMGIDGKDWGLDTHCADNV